MVEIFSLFLWIPLALQNIKVIRGVKNIEESSQVKTFNKHENFRIERSTVVTSCPPTSFVNKTILRTTKREKNNLILICPCQRFDDQAITWLDGKCDKIFNEVERAVQNRSLVIAKPNPNSSVFYCTNYLNCTYKISVSEQVIITGMPRPLQGFVMFFVIVCTLAIGVCVYKKCRYQIYLGCRDCCPSPGNADGKEFDAYISMGKNVSDIKFVQKNIIDFLQIKCNYKVFLDEDNLLPRLDYSEKVQTKMHLCRRLIIVFTPAYMANEWCMYCFSEGLRKILDLGIELIFIVTDVSIQRELSALSSLIGHVPKLFFSTLPMMQNKSEKNRFLQKLRVLMPPSPRGGHSDKGMKAPMLRNAEDIDQRSLRESDSYGGTKYTAGSNNGKNDVKMDDFDLGEQEMEFDDEDPNSIKIKQYKTRKDFFRIALVDDMDEKE